MVVLPRRWATNRSAISASVCASTAGWIDQDQDLGVEPEHSCQHDPLPLAAGQSAATLVDATLPTSMRTGEHIFRRGNTQHRLGLGEAETSVRIDGGLQRAREDLACGIADHNPLPHLINTDIAEVHGAEAHPHFCPASCRSRSASRARSARCCFAADGQRVLETVRDVQADRFMISR